MRRIAKGCGPSPLGIQQIRTANCRRPLTALSRGAFGIQQIRTADLLNWCRLQDSNL